MTEFNIRNATMDDFNKIKKLNDDFVSFTSPIDLARIEQLHNFSAYHRVIETHSKSAENNDYQVLGFLLALPTGIDYDSENYQWFDRRYQNFLYVDRIVVDSSLQGIGLGRKLYQDLFSYAKAEKIGHICCEYNLIPANPISASFHHSFGFHQVGRLTNEQQTKVVSLQMASAM